MWTIIQKFGSSTLKFGGAVLKWGVILHCTFEYLGDFVIVSEFWEILYILYIFIDLKKYILLFYL